MDGAKRQKRLPFSAVTSLVSERGIYDCTAHPGLEPPSAPGKVSVRTLRTLEQLCTVNERPGRPRQLDVLLNLTNFEPMRHRFVFFKETSEIAGSDGREVCVPGVSF